MELEVGGASSSPSLLLSHELEEYQLYHKYFYKKAAGYPVSNFGTLSSLLHLTHIWPSIPWDRPIYGVGGDAASKGAVRLRMSVMFARFPAINREMSFMSEKLLSRTKRPQR